MKALKDYLAALHFWLVTYNNWPKHHLRGAWRGLCLFVGLLIGPMIVAGLLLFPEAVKKQLAAKERLSRY